VDNKEFAVVENIVAFLQACVGVFQLRLSQLFTEADLVKGKGLVAVVDCLYLLAQRAHLYNPDAPRLEEIPVGFEYPMDMLELAVKYYFPTILLSDTPR
jgi:hypothetical protein